jgi:hypothetical protein
VVQLAEEAQKSGYVPAEGESNLAREWLPMIKGYLHLFNYDAAGRISQKLVNFDLRMRPMICSAWQNISQENSPHPADRIRWMNQLQCTLD